MTKARMVVLGAAACVAACVDSGVEREASAEAAEHKNIEYTIAGRTIRLIDGVNEAPAAPGSAAKIVTRYFGNEARGDLNADGREDVAFLLTQETGGSGTFFYAVAAVASERGLRGSEAVLLGDRIAPQTTQIANGAIVVSYAGRGPGDSLASMPSVAKSISLKLDARTMRLGELVQDFEGEANPASMKLDMKTWVWVRATDGGNEIVPRQAEAFTLTFSGDTFSATTDCNQVRGGYTAQGRTLTFAETMAATRMFCADSQEQVFVDVLRKATRYNFTSRGELVLELEGGGTATFR
jgi:heat shock protein HslJ